MPEFTAWLLSVLLLWGSRNQPSAQNENEKQMNSPHHTQPAPVVNTRLASYNDDDYFGPQRTASSELPDPRPLGENLARNVMEILAGARELEQISRWVTDDVYRNLIIRVHASARARALKKLPVARPVFTLGSTLASSPADGVVEMVIVVHGRARTRSIAMRLEGLDGRWRAAAIHVL